ncbi:MAG: CAP domain-containing protein [Actinomycetes bacterium]|jgi:uncharacterized protein YkwD|nr:CAP domain-containing protein [Actinomycetes bacterium]
MEDWETYEDWPDATDSADGTLTPAPPQRRSRGTFRLAALLLALTLLLPLAASFGSLAEQLSSKSSTAGGHSHIMPVEGSLRYDFAWEVLRLTNEQRAEAGLPALGMHIDLVPVAMLRARECCLRFSHTRPNGRSVSDALPPGIGGAGENIAIGQRSPAEVVAGWMNSPGHRANILNPNYHSIGVGVFATFAPGNKDEQLSWAQVFSTNPAATQEKPANVAGIFDDVVVDTAAYPLQFQAVFLHPDGLIQSADSNDTPLSRTTLPQVLVGGADTLVTLACPPSRISWIRSISSGTDSSGGDPLESYLSTSYSAIPSLNAWIGSWHLLTLPMP